MEEYIYMCENKDCKEFGIEKAGKEKICPRCGVETVIYRMKKYVPPKFVILFVIVLILLIISIVGYCYLFFSSSSPLVLSNRVITESALSP